MKSEKKPYFTALEFRSSHLKLWGRDYTQNSLPDGFLVQDQLQHQHTEDTISIQ